MSYISPVEYDLEKSKFKVEDGEMVYYFSSKFNQERFEKMLENRGLERRKLEVKLNCWIKPEPEAIDLMIYKSIEKRGFYVTINDTAISKDYEIDMKVVDNGNTL